MKKRFKQLRKLLGSQSDVAEILDTTYQTVLNKERGLSRTYSRDVLALERAAQSKDNRLVELIARSLCRTSRVYYLRGKDSNVAVDIEDYVDRNWTTFEEEAARIVSESIYEERVEDVDEQ